MSYRQIGVAQVVDKNGQQVLLCEMEAVVSARHHGDKSAVIGGLRHLQTEDGVFVQRFEQAYLSEDGQVFRPV